MQKVTVGRVLIAVFGCIALAAIVGGIAIIGTPAERRLIELDKKRVEDLNQLRRAVRGYHDRNSVLPKSLADISSEWVAYTCDPVTDEPYAYRVTGDRSFQLCGVFARKRDKPEPDSSCQGHRSAPSRRCTRRLSLLSETG